MDIATINCPRCMSGLQLPPEMAGKLVKCPSCQFTFTARGDGSVLPLDSAVEPRRVPPIDVASPPPRPDDRSRTRGDRYDDDEDDYWRHPVRRRGYHDDYDDYDDRYGDPGQRKFGRQSRDLRIAREAVAPPAVFLMILGGIHVLIGMGISLFAMERHGNGEVRAITLIVSMAVMGWGGFLIAGGVMMKNMRYYGIAMAASIMALITHPCNVLGIGLGVWGIVVLSKSEVRNAFRWTSGRG